MCTRKFSFNCLGAEIFTYYLFIRIFCDRGKNIQKIIIYIQVTGENISTFQTKFWCSYLQNLVLLEEMRRAQIQNYESSSSCSSFKPSVIVSSLGEFEGLYGGYTTSGGATSIQHPNFLISSAIFLSFFAQKIEKLTIR